MAKRSRAGAISSPIANQRLPRSQVHRVLSALSVTGAEPSSSSVRRALQPVYPRVLAASTFFDRVIRNYVTPTHVRSSRAAVRQLLYQRYNVAPRLTPSRSIPFSVVRDARRYCGLRSKRREVIFAMGIAGRRGVGRGRPRRTTVYSQYTCRR